MAGRMISSPARSLLYLLATLLVTALAAPAAAQEPVPRGLPPAPKPTEKFPGQGLVGIGDKDPRVPAVLEDMPWRALGRLETRGGICTAALIAPDILLTAAHCVFDHQARRFAAPQDLRFRLGYDRGRFVAEARGTRVAVHPAYDPVLSIGTMARDWALVRLDAPIGAPDRFLPLREISPPVGTAVALGGYSKDHVERLMADPACRVLGIMSDRDGLPLVRHDCTGAQGSSGAPLLVKEDNGWSVGGVQVVARRGAGGAATVLFEVAAELKKLQQ